MSTLSDRLAAARRHQRGDRQARRRVALTTYPTASHRPPATAAAAKREPLLRVGERPRQGGSTAGPKTDATRRRAGRLVASQQTDRIDELKASVHTELLKQLGPHLYDAEMDQHQLDQQVRTVLADVLSAQDRPLSSSDRARVTQEISDDILGYGPIEPFLRDVDVSEVMVNGHDSIWLEKSGQARAGRRHSSPTRRTCGARSTRSCRASVAASTRRARWSTPACPTAAA